MHCGCVAITGGEGFLGTHLANHILLHWSEVPKIRLIDRKPISTTGILLPSTKFEHIHADLSVPAEAEAALKDVDIVFHLAAIVDWGLQPYKVVFNGNISCTQNVLDACVKNKVRALVGASSIDVVTRPGKHLLDIKEEMPTNSHPDGAYTASKIECEKRMLRADSPAGLRTAVLRPLALYGPGDPYQCPAFIDNVKAGRMVCRIGSGKAVFHMGYAENVAHAILTVGKRVWEEINGARYPETALGQLFNISDSPPANYFDFYGPIVEWCCNDLDQTLPYYDQNPHYGLACEEMPPLPPAPLSPPPKKGGKKRQLLPTVKLPFWLLYVFACVVEFFCWLLGLCPPLKRRLLGDAQPVLNRTSVTLICTSVSTNSDKLRRVLRWAPPITQEEAYRRTIHYFRAKEKAALLHAARVVRATEEVRKAD